MSKVMALAACLWCTAGTLIAPHAYSLGAEDNLPAVSGKVQVLSVGQMDPADAALLATRRQELATAAEFHGYDVSSGAWIQSQIACPYAPRYIILHDLQLSHEGSISLFTALVPRGSGQIRIIPVLHHGVQALGIVGSTPGQRSLIDEVISARMLSEPRDPHGDWATLAYCYGALAGAEPVSFTATNLDQTVPRLYLDQNGKIREMSFSVLGPDKFYQDWTIQFDGHAKVKSIGLAVRALNPPREIPAGNSPRERKVPVSAPPVPKPVPPPAVKADSVLKIPASHGNFSN